VNNKYAIIHKKIGETPLEALERFRAEKIESAKSCVGVGMCDDSMSEISYWKDVPMTYAGRLDPMAEGQLLILIGDECKNKQKYLGLDKEYEVEILFGVETDTYDILGIPKIAQNTISNDELLISKIENDFFANYVGRFSQKYPAYSSKTVDGRQLHDLARSGELPDEMPTKEVEIYSIESLEEREIAPTRLREYVYGNISKLSSSDGVKSDFRQKEILAKWDEIFANLQQNLYVIRIKVACSSGTYMRSLADRMGRDMGTVACALSINRTKIVGIS